MVGGSGLEPTASASAGLRSIQLSYKRKSRMVPKGRFELPCPYGHYALNVARLPFRHFGIIDNNIPLPYLRVSPIYLNEVRLTRIVRTP